jgi:hypothetical protein
MGSRPEQSEPMPSAHQVPAPESRPLDSDDTQRYAVKPRMFEEGAPTQGVSQRTVEAPAMPVAEPAPRREPVAAPAPTPVPAPAPASAPVNAPATDTPAPQPTVFGRR